LFNLENGLAAIRAAFGADMMHDMILATVFTDDEMIERQRVVRTAAITTTARVFALGQRTHEIAPDVIKPVR